MHTVDRDLATGQAVLQSVFDFSQADLQLNRTGELSHAQQERISRTHFANSRFAWIAFLIVFGVGFLGFCADMLRTGTFGAKTLSIFAGVTVFFGLILWGFILFYRYQMKRTLRDGKTYPVEGAIQLLLVRDEKSMQRYFCINKHRFRIDRYSHFKQLEEAGLAGQEAIMYVSTPRQAVQSVELKS